MLAAPLTRKSGTAFFFCDLSEWGDVPDVGFGTDEREDMSIALRRAVVLALVCVSVTVLAQQQHTDAAVLTRKHHEVERSVEALYVLKASILAMHAQPVSEANVSGQILNSSGVQVGSFRWKHTPELHEFEITKGEDYRHFVSGPGKIQNEQDGKSRPLKAHQVAAYVPTYLPGQLMLKALTDTKWSVVLVGNETYDDTSCFHVRLADERTVLSSAVSVQDWWIDASSGIPLKLETRIPDEHNALVFEIQTTRYMKWRQSSLGLVPVELRNCGEGHCGVTFQAIDFEVVAGGAQ
jgi:hypothetical protein